MGPIPTPILVVRARVATLEGGFENVSYWEAATAPTTSSQADAIAAGFETIFSPLYVACMNAQSTWSGCDVTYYGGSTTLKGSSSNAIAGNLNNSPISDQNAVVIRKETGLAGRSALGRFFIGAMDNTAFSTTAPDEVSTGTLTFYQSLASAYGGDQTFGPTLAHSRHWNRKLNTMQVVSECKVSSRIATRRDRRRHAANFPE